VDEFVRLLALTAAAAAAVGCEVERMLLMLLIIQHALGWGVSGQRQLQRAFDDAYVARAERRRSLVGEPCGGEVLQLPLHEVTMHEPAA